MVRNKATSVREFETTLVDIESRCVKRCKEHPQRLGSMGGSLRSALRAYASWAQVSGLSLSGCLLCKLRTMFFPTRANPFYAKAMRRLKKDPKAKRRDASSSTEWDNSDEEVEDIVRNWRPGKAMRKRIKEANLTNLHWSNVFPGAKAGKRLLLSTGRTSSTGTRLQSSEAPDPCHWRNSRR